MAKRLTLGRESDIVAQERRDYYVNPAGFRLIDRLSVRA